MNEARPWDIFPRENCPRDNFGLSHFSDKFLLTGTLILSQGLFCNSPGEMCPRDTFPRDMFSQEKQVMSRGNMSQGPTSFNTLLFCNSPGEMCPRDMSLGHISPGHVFSGKASHVPGKYVPGTDFVQHAYYYEAMFHCYLFFFDQEEK